MTTSSDRKARIRRWDAVLPWAIFLAVAGATLGVLQVLIVRLLK